VVAALDRPPADDGQIKPGGSSAPHALYNIGNSRSEELGRVIELLEQATGRTAVLDPQPMQLGEVSETLADLGASERDLGFKPATSIDEGIPRFVDWYRGYHEVR
jgi:UDP-glucuronate 4-epimerase